MNINCICDSKKYIVVGIKDGKEIASCSRCGHWYIPEVSDEYDELYESGLYQNGYQVSIGHIPYKERYDHDYKIAKSRLDKLEEYCLDENLLDIGCSNGAFVHRAIEYGYRPIGIDLDKNTDNIEHCFCRTVEDIESKSKDVITMHDSIEHFTDMNFIFSELKRIIKPNGMIAIEVPNFSCVEFIEDGINWKHVRPLEHIHMMSVKDYFYMFDKYELYLVHISIPIQGKLLMLVWSNQ